MMSTLEQARDALASISGLASCKIGIEANISPASYPMIRVVPSRVIPGKPYTGRTVETLLYFGTQTGNAQGLETVYENLSELESDMLDILKALGARYVETITDEDRLDTYKLMAIRCELLDPPGAFVRCQIDAATIVQGLTATPAALAPFTSTTLESAAADWTPTPAAGTIARLLNGAASTSTRLTASGTVAGPDGAAVLLAIYADGVRLGNAVQVLTTGPSANIAFSVQASNTAVGAVTFDVRAAADQEEEFSFAAVQLLAAG
jgi:hypothetical protein